MATRDRSQGFAFVYVDVAQLLKERDEVGKRLEHPQQNTAQSVNMNRDRRVLDDDDTLEMPRPGVNQVKQNLDRLQTLHHKLHAMLEEMDKVAAAKKRNK